MGCDVRNGDVFSFINGERKQKRQELARPIMVGLKAWMESEGVQYSPSSLMGKAVTYAYTRGDRKDAIYEQSLTRGITTTTTASLEASTPGDTTSN